MSYDERDRRHFDDDDDPAGRHDARTRDENQGAPGSGRHRRRTWGARAMTGSTYGGGTVSGHFGGGSFGSSGYGGQVYGRDRHVGGSHYSGIGHAGSDHSGSPGPHSGKGPKRYRRADEKIVEDACEALERDGQVDASDVEVECKEGVITLTGTIDSRSAKCAAEAAVEYVFGVRDVMNQLRLQQPQEGRGIRSRPSKTHDSQ